MSTDILSIVLQLVVNNASALELAYLLTHVLQMRSNRAYVITLLAGTNLTLVLHYLGVPSIVRLLLVTIPFYYLLPIAWSKGPINRRIIWATLSLTCLLVGEVTGALTYNALTGSLYYQAVTASTIPLIALTYTVSFISIGIIALLFVALHNRIDLGESPVSMVPIALLLIWSFVFFARLIVRWSELQSVNAFSSSSAAMLICALLDIFIAFYSLSLAQAEAEASRKQAEAAALMRQTKHIRAEILTSSKHSAELKELRHELATQVGIISSLQERGDLDEVGKRLDVLLDQAQQIAGEANA